MENKKEFKEEIRPEPTFLEQANAMIEDSYAVQVEDPKFGHGLNIRDHKLLVKIMDLHESTVYDTLVEKFSGVVFGHYNPIMKAIEGIAQDLSIIEKNNRAEHTRILKWIEDISDKEKKLEQNISRSTVEIEIINKRLDNKRKIIEKHSKSIDVLEKDIALLDRKILNKIHLIESEIHGEKPFVIGTYKLEKWILAGVGAIIISTLITLAIMKKHARDVKESHKLIPEIENIIK